MVSRDNARTAIYAAPRQIPPSWIQVPFLMSQAAALEATDAFRELARVMPVTKNPSRERKP